MCFFSSLAFAADGSGTNVVSPDIVPAFSVDQAFTFTFTASETMDSGEVKVNVPISRGWSIPQGSIGSGGYTTVSSSGAGTIATVLSNADSATGWTEDDSDACNVAAPSNGFGISTAVFKEGVRSITCNNTGSTEPDATDSFGYDFLAQNWSSYTQAGFWIRSSANTASGHIQAAIDNTHSCTSPVEEVNIPALTANTWTYVKWNFVNSGSSRTSITTFCFNAGNNVGMDLKQIWVDDLLIGPGVPTFLVNGLDRDIAVRILDLTSTETIIVNYGVGGGSSGIDVPSSAGVDEFTTMSRTSSGGTLVNLGSSPTVSVVAGSLGVDIVNAAGSSVALPSVSFSGRTYAFSSQTSSGTLGTSLERIRVSNTTASPTWALTIAATNGGTALWGSNSYYDYNDASGASDGSDADLYGGVLTIDPSTGTVITVAPCSSTTGISKGSSQSFQETAPVVSSITLLTASSSALTNCSWDFTGVSLMQTIPPSQASGNYTISFTLTVV